MYDITAEQLFDYLLKDKMARKRQMIDDIQNGNLPPDAINSELLAANKVITENDSLDSDLDYIDSVLGDPQVEPADDWIENAVAQQIENPKIANNVYNNIRNTEDYNDLKDIEKDASVERDTDSAKQNRDAVRLDRMLYNINKDNMLADSEKVDMALRLLFDYNTRRFGMYPEDIRLSQRDIWKQLLFNETPGERLEDYQHNAFVHDPKRKKLKNISDPSFMEKERITSDAVPLSYESDKDNTIGQLFTPSLEANTVYEIFANALIDDIKNNKAPALDSMSKYINDTYHNKLKTMTYSDWEKEIAKELTPVDIDKIMEQVYKPAEAKLESTGSALGDEIAWRVKNKRLELENSAGYEHDRHLAPKEVRGMVEAYLVAANDDLDVPEDVLTPEDWADKLPDNPRLRGKSKEEKEENKLNRWHDADKEAYKEYLAEMADTRDPESVSGMLYAPEIDQQVSAIKDYMNAKAPELIKQFKTEQAAGHTVKAEALANKINYYRELLSGSDEGKIELTNWAHRIISGSHRNKYDLKPKKTYNTTSTVNSLLKDSEALWKQEDAEGNVTERKPMTQFERDAYKWLDSMQKRWNRYNAKDISDDDIRDIEIEEKSKGKSKNKPREDWEKDLVDMEEENGLR